MKIKIDKSTIIAMKLNPCLLIEQVERKYVRYTTCEDYTISWKYMVKIKMYYINLLAISIEHSKELYIRNQYRFEVK